MPRPVGIPLEIRCAAKVTISVAVKLAEMLALVPEQWHLFFWFLAATGVRISKAVALQWRHLALDASVPHVKVKGRMGPPKSRYGRRCESDAR